VTCLSNCRFRLHREGLNVKNRPISFAFVILSALLAVTAKADTLELANGGLLEGKFIGSSNGIIMFDAGGGIEAFPESEVVGVFFSSGVETAEKYLAEAPTSITAPAGTRLVIRTTDEVDSRRHGAGHRFRGQLEGAIVIDGETVAPRGTFVHGRITQASQAGRVAGSSELVVEFTDIMLDDQLLPIRTGDLSAQAGGEAGRTIGRTARSAAIGGLIGGRSGARTGAAVGAGASLITRGSNVNIPRGTIVETRLDSPLTVQI
jgi:hypothetical protein